MDGARQFTRTGRMIPPLGLTMQTFLDEIKQVLDDGVPVYSSLTPSSQEVWDSVGNDRLMNILMTGIRTVGGTVADIALSQVSKVPFDQDLLTEIRSRADQRLKTELPWPVWLRNSFAL